MIDEIWKAFDNCYDVSTHGRVKNTRSGYILNPFLDSDGYPCITLYGVTAKVHRMVAKTFIPNPDNLPTVNHKDGTKTNNFVINLEWASVADNNAHAGFMGLMPRGVECHTAILDEEMVIAIKKLFVEYKLGDRDIGRIFGVSEGTVHNIRIGVAWKHVASDLVFNDKGPNGRGEFAKKLSGADIPIIRKMAADGLNNQTIGRKFNVAPATIRGILLGNTWKNY